MRPEPLITLDCLTIGQSGRVQSIALYDEGATRLMEMGLIPGTTVKVARVAPLGDPIDILVRGYHLSLRLAEAKAITLVCDTNKVLTS